jgi:hypothetical protein
VSDLNPRGPVTQAELEERKRQRDAGKRRVQPLVILLGVLGVIVVLSRIIPSGSSVSTPSGVTSSIQASTQNLPAPANEPATVVTRQVMITSDPVGASVTVDGRAVGITPLTVSVPDGQSVPYTVKAGSAVPNSGTYREYRGTLNVTKNENISVWLDRIPAPAYRGTNLSTTQIMNYLTSFFGPLERGDIDDGTPRYMSTSSNGLVILELQGQRENVSSAALIVGLPSDRQDLVMENTAISLRFLKNVAPGWDGAADWLTNSLGTLTHSPDSEITTGYGSNVITLKLFAPLGMLSLSIEPR